MIHIVLIMEDTTIVADFRDGHWEGVVSDGLSGKSVPFKWTSPDFAAIAALAIGGDDLEEFLTTALYSVAEPLLIAFPPEVRPIP